jgi:hypothetical protein
MQNVIALPEFAVITASTVTITIAITITITLTIFDAEGDSGTGVCSDYRQQGRLSGAML